MKKNLYIAPALTVVLAEPHIVIAVSMDTSKVEWKNDVDFEVKEQSADDINVWDEIW